MRLDCTGPLPLPLRNKSFHYWNLETVNFENPTNIVNTYCFTVKILSHHHVYESAVGTTFLVSRQSNDIWGDEEVPECELLFSDDQDERIVPEYVHVRVLTYSRYS